MPAERWVLVGPAPRELLKPLRAAISGAGYRMTRVSTVEECVTLSKRRSFLCAFLSPGFFRSFSRRAQLSSNTYVALFTEPNDQRAALDFQSAGKCHDVLFTPLQESYAVSTLYRAKTFFRQTSELEAIKTLQSAALRNDASVLCTGKWAASALRWTEQVRSGHAPLLLMGEAGSGKTLLARLVHFGSLRADAPFVTVRCHERDAKELERELFGEIPPRNHAAAAHQRSAFSIAANGSILLDRADQLPRILQHRLARVISTRRYSPVGGGEQLPLECRLIFTVQDNIPGAGVNKILQRDLARLLKSTTLRIPALRDRRDDLPEIVSNILEKLRRDRGMRSGGISEQSLELLKGYPWPGNVRELEGILWGASVLAGRHEIAPKNLAPFLANGNGSIHTEEVALEEIVSERLNALFARFGVDHLKDLHPMILERVEKPLVHLVLKQTKGNQIRAASVLGINRNTLRRKMTQYGLSRL